MSRVRMPIFGKFVILKFILYSKTIKEYAKNNSKFRLGAITTNNELDQKYLWLKENYPNIKRKHIFFISSTMLKPEVIIECCKHFHIALEDVAFVDDRIDVLRKAEEMGITAYHPSSFVE